MISGLGASIIRARMDMMIYGQIQVGNYTEEEMQEIAKMKTIDLPER